MATDDKKYIDDIRSTFNDLLSRCDTIHDFFGNRSHDKPEQSRNQANMLGVNRKSLKSKKPVANKKKVSEAMKNNLKEIITTKKTSKKRILEIFRSFIAPDSITEIESDNTYGLLNTEEKVMIFKAVVFRALRSNLPDLAYRFNLYTSLINDEIQSGDERMKSLYNTLSDMLLETRQGIDEPKIAEAYEHIYDTLLDKFGYDEYKISEKTELIINTYTDTNLANEINTFYELEKPNKIQIVVDTPGSFPWKDHFTVLCNLASEFDGANTYGDCNKNQKCNEEFSCNLKDSKHYEKILYALKNITLTKTPDCQTGATLDKEGDNKIEIDNKNNIARSVADLSSCIKHNILIQDGKSKPQNCNNLSNPELLDIKRSGDAMQVLLTKRTNFNSKIPIVFVTIDHLAFLKARLLGVNAILSSQDKVTLFKPSTKVSKDDLDEIVENVRSFIANTIDPILFNIDSISDSATKYIKTLETKLKLQQPTRTNRKEEILTIIIRILSTLNSKITQIKKELKNEKDKAEEYLISCRNISDKREKDICIAIAQQSIKQLETTMDLDIIIKSKNSNAIAKLLSLFNLSSIKKHGVESLVYDIKTIIEYLSKQPVLADDILKVIDENVGQLRTEIKQQGGFQLQTSLPQLQNLISFKSNPSSLSVSDTEAQKSNVAVASTSSGSTDIRSSEMDNENVGYLLIDVLDMIENTDDIIIEDTTTEDTITTYMSTQLTNLNTMLDKKTNSDIWKKPEYYYIVWAIVNYPKICRDILNLDKTLLFDVINKLEYLPLLSESIDENKEYCMTLYDKLYLLDFYGEAEEAQSQPRSISQYGGGDMKSLSFYHARYYPKYLRYYI